MSGVHLHLHQLAVGYNGRALIHGIEIGVRRGEIVTLIGPNGAGKSTILKSITRQLEPIDGKVLLEMTRTAGSSKAESLKTESLKSIKKTASLRNIWRSVPSTRSATANGSGSSLPARSARNRRSLSLTNRPPFWTYDTSWNSFQSSTKWQNRSRSRSSCPCMRQISR